MEKSKRNLANIFVQDMTSNEYHNYLSDITLNTINKITKQEEDYEFVKKKRVRQIKFHKPLNDIRLSPLFNTNISIFKSDNLKYTYEVMTTNIHNLCIDKSGFDEFGQFLVNEVIATKYKLLQNKTIVTFNENNIAYKEEMNYKELKNEELKKQLKNEELKRLQKECKNKKGLTKSLIEPIIALNLYQNSKQLVLKTKKLEHQKKLQDILIEKEKEGFILLEYSQYDKISAFTSELDYYNKNYLTIKDDIFFRVNSRNTKNSYPCDQLELALIKTKTFTYDKVTKYNNHNACNFEKLDISLDFFERMSLNTNKNLAKVLLNKLDTARRSNRYNIYAQYDRVKSKNKLILLIKGQYQNIAQSYPYKIIDKNKNIGCLKIGEINLNRIKDKDFLFKDSYINLVKQFNKVVKDYCNDIFNTNLNNI